MYYIFETEQQAIDYDNQVSIAENYQEGGNWDNPRKHPNINKWAITKHEKYPIQGKQSEELSSDWVSEL